MFSKNDTQTAAAPQPTPDPRPAAAPSVPKSVLSSDLRIVGDLSSLGLVEINGTVEGTVVARGLVIGPEGTLTGTVSAETVEVKGALDGRVSTESFTLRSSAKVQADVTYTSTLIEAGAQFQGRFTRAKTAEANKKA